ncbi:beta-lactamase regulating signal transducer with metallopeptidase domain [Flavobacterium sp. 28YEA47A]|uniref:M56 family metallopeptidase n=1 Tax=Flavobacterium sp. 28YEA47A TaxID=3156276 RepID=UPI0035178B7F
MTDFIIKSTVSLTVLLGIYYLFLEKEKMHTFNRFYLLFSLVLSFAIPFITIEVAVESLPKPLVSQLAPAPTPVPAPAPILIPSQDQAIASRVATVQEAETNYLPVVLWSLYALATTFLVIRFGKNIYSLILKAKKSRRVAFNCSTLVLSKEEQLPHTFLKYIFINEDDFNSHKIQEELYTHELAHVKQKHTYDVLFIEILKTLFWFNPILVFYKKAIQLNHEFLADENVVESHKNVPFYQNLLIEKASWNSNFYLASNLNFSVTKKRLIMMTKTTSKSRALLKKIALAPILSGLLLVSCIENTPANAQTAMSATCTADPSSSDKETEVWINGERVKDSEMNLPLSNWKNKNNQTNEVASIENTSANAQTTMSATCTAGPSSGDKETEVWINGERVKDSEMNLPISHWKNKNNQTNEAAYFKGVRFIIYKTGTWTKDRLQGKDIILDKTYDELTAKEKERFKPHLRIPQGTVKKSPTAAELEEYKNSKKYAIWINEVYVPNSELNKYSPSDIAFFSGSSVAKNARTQKHPQPYQFTFYTHAYFDKKQMDKAPAKYPLDKIEIFDKIIKK